MKTAKSAYVFFECTNSSCKLRFPLDAALYDGHYCPRCGAPLEKHESGVLAQKPPAAPKPGFDLIGALDNVRSAHNVGAIFRTAEGAGLSELLLGGITPTPDQLPSISKTALGAESSVKWCYSPNLFAALTELKANSCLILALEYTPNACSLLEFQPNYPLPRQVALVVGSEPAGVDPAILQIADQVLYIPMSGDKTSLNVSIAFGIAVYQLSRF